MKSLFDIQAESGLLWLDIKAQLDAKEAEIPAAVAAAKLEIQTTLDTLVQAGQAAHAAGDFDALGAVLAQAAGYMSAARAAAIAKRKAELEAQIAALG